MGNVIMDDGIIDIYSHIVYGIDDGAYTIKRADNQMIEGEAEGAHAGMRLLLSGICNEEEAH